jgi:hypothetical protein
VCMSVCVTGNRCDNGSIRQGAVGGAGYVG